MYQKGFSNILLIIVGIIIALAAIGMYSSMKNRPKYAPTPVQTPSVATPIPSPTTPTPTPTPVVTAPCGIHVTSPSSTTPQTSPMTITGYVDGQCHWGAFEGQTGTVTVFNDKNVALSSQIPLTATEDWMQQVVHFQVKIGYSAPHSTNGYLLFSNEDASGMFPQTYQYPIKFQP